MELNLGERKREEDTVVLEAQTNRTAKGKANMQLSALFNLMNPAFRGRS